MKIAFVVGFYDSVKTALNARYPAPTYQDRLIWIAGGSHALVAFKKRFYDVVETAEGLLVCLGRGGTEQYVEDHMRGIIGVAEAKFTTPIHFRVVSNKYDPKPIVALVESFGLETEAALEVSHIRAKVAEGKILCVSLEGKTGVLVALQRAGMSAKAIEECFVEEKIKGGKNSNLMQHLKQRALHHPCLLYAWNGLRSSPPEVRTAYKVFCFEAQNAFQVVEGFMKWIREGL